MKRKNQILSAVLALMVFAAMAMGSGSSSDPGAKEEEQKPITAPSSTGEETAAPAVSIEEQLLLDRDGIRITAKEYVEDEIWGDGIKLLLENNTEQDVGISCNALIVNDYMITDLFSESVAAGKKANSTLWLSSSGLEAAGIENVGKIELYFHVYNGDSYQEIFDADAVTIQTSAFDSMDSTVDDAGQELYNQNGVRIVGKVVDEDSFWGTAVLLYLENNSGRNIRVGCDDMSINGFMVSPLFSSEVYDGKKALDEITIFDSELEENDITSIDEIELTFRIYDAESYQTIDETEPITFTAG